MDSNLTEKNTLKKIILSTFLEEEMLMSITFKTFPEYGNVMRVMITKLTQENYLTAKKISVKNKNRTYIVNYKTITKKGLQWLRDNCQNDYPWLKYTPNVIPTFHFKRNKHATSYLRYIKSCSISLLFRQLDINSVDNDNLIFDDIKTSEYYKNIIYRAKKEFKEREKNRYKTEQKLHEKNRYYISTRNLLSKMQLTTEEIQQYKHIQSIGILFYDSKSFIIYTGTPQGYKIIESPTKSIKYLVYKYKQKFQEQFDNNYDSMKRGIMFVKDEREWVQNFKQNICVKKTMQKKNINELFQMFYLLPIHRDTIYLLSYLLYFDEEYKTTFMNQLINNNPIFHREIGGYSCNGCEAEFGMDMNLCTLFKTYHKAISHPEKKYIIVCQEWQSVLYKEVMPKNIEYQIINIPPKIIKQ